MTLQNKHIRLRAPELSDLDVLLSWENEESLWYLSQNLLPFSRFDMEQFILNNSHDIYQEKQFRFMIEKKDSLELLGCVDLFDFNPHHKRAGIGILIDEKHRSRGFASQALDLIISYSFQQLHLHQIYCNILENNINSKKLFEKKQFLPIGVKQDWILVKNRFQNEILYQLIHKK
ncbi:MAG: GNAT family N-acetyltransferase [Bacteroidetes bacterium 4572_77]|nr:MAG: GNAT family N-acetyltransferase [Bacteroidetes bacterium 4572_77]